MATFAKPEIKRFVNLEDAGSLKQLHLQRSPPVHKRQNSKRSVRKEMFSPKSDRKKVTNV